jgi:hypothetical protein
MNDEERCPATNRNGQRCGHPTGWGTDNEGGPCKFHGGAAENQGAPEGNQNAMTHGLTADPMNLFDWLADNDPEGAAYILGKLHDYASRAPRDVFVVDFDADDVETFDDATAKLTGYGDDLLTTCVRDYARKRAEYIQITEGIITEQQRATESGAVTIEDSNPVNMDLDRFDRNQLRRKDKLGLLPDDGADVEVALTSQMWDDLTGYYEED